MSLDNIKLSPVVLADLYKNSLVQLEDTKKNNPANQSVTTTKYLGENKKAILILVNNAESPFLNEASFQFLVSILTACKLSMADVALVNKANLTVPLSQLIEELSSGIVLIFGMEAKEMNLPFNFPYYQVQKHGKLTYLTADDFEAIGANKQRKAQLWLCLKRIFDL
ncbi:MAG TPA: hypothetical protein VFN30_13745 [Chitinophagaceae bacterium]|nr:hypothetical protein [Chitinophagaceae bacterium]